MIYIVSFYLQRHSLNVAMGVHTHPHMFAYIIYIYIYSHSSFIKNDVFICKQKGVHIHICNLKMIRANVNEIYINSF